MEEVVDFVFIWFSRARDDTGQINVFWTIAKEFGEIHADKVDGANRTNFPGRLPTMGVEPINVESEGKAYFSIGMFRLEKWLAVWTSQSLPYIAAKNIDQFSGYAFP
jgi:hypothetical protein